jgi:rhomboid protease GluP
MWWNYVLSGARSQESICEMNFEEYEVVVKETWLSKKPAEGSGLVAAASLLVLMGFSLLFWSDYSGLAPQLPANGELVFKQGQYWRLFTSIFVHADLRHLLSNALGMGGLSYLLYGYFGCKVYPCLTLGGGAVVTLIALATYPPHTFLLGASGVIYFMAAFWLTLYVCLERRFSVGKRILRATGFLLIALIPTSFNPETSYRTHAIGFGIGIVVAALYFAANKDRFRRAEEVEIDGNERIEE